MTSATSARSFTILLRRGRRARSPRCRKKHRRVSCSVTSRGCRGWSRSSSPWRGHPAELDREEGRRERGQQIGPAGAPARPDRRAPRRAAPRAFVGRRRGLAVHALHERLATASQFAMCGRAGWKTRHHVRLGHGRRVEEVREEPLARRSCARCSSSGPSRPRDTVPGARGSSRPPSSLSHLGRLQAGLAVDGRVPGGEERVAVAQGTSRTPASSITISRLRFARPISTKPTCAPRRLQRARATAGSCGASCASAAAGVRPSLRRRASEGSCCSSVLPPKSVGNPCSVWRLPGW
jgi:hypothetical protein